MRITIYVYAMTIVAFSVTMNMIAASSSRSAGDLSIRNTKGVETTDEDSPRTKGVKKKYHYDAFKASPSADQVLPQFKISPTSTSDDLKSLAGDDMPEQDSPTPIRSATSTGSPSLSSSSGSPEAYSANSSGRMRRSSYLDVQDGIPSVPSSDSLQALAAKNRHTSSSSENLVVIAGAKRVANN